jgi:surface-anchored protein
VAAGGQFSVYQTDGFGTPIAQIKSYDGITGYDMGSLAAGGHEHYNFAFTQPGVYEVTFQIECTHAIDGALSAAATYTFGIGAIPEPSSYAAIVGVGMLGLSLVRRRRVQA